MVQQSKVMFRYSLESSQRVDHFCIKKHVFRLAYSCPPDSHKQAFFVPNSSFQKISQGIFLKNRKNVGFTPLGLKKFKTELGIS